MSARRIQLDLGPLSVPMPDPIGPSFMLTSVDQSADGGRFAHLLADAERRHRDATTPANDLEEAEDAALTAIDSPDDQQRTRSLSALLAGIGRYAGTDGMACCRLTVQPELLRETRLAVSLSGDLLIIEFTIGDAGAYDWLHARLAGLVEMLGTRLSRRLRVRLCGVDDPGNSLEDEIRSVTELAWP